MTYRHQRATAGLGALLQHWRRVRNVSQLALAHEASVSPRHVCFVETGRSQPSRDMVLLLADALRIPFRERNALLLAAGYAPMFQESSLDARELAPVRAAVDAILRQQAPYPAVVMNRHWDILTANDAATRFFTRLLDGRTPPDAGNVLRLMFHPDGVRPCVENWETVAPTLLQRVHREAVGGALDDRGHALLKEVLAYPGVPASWSAPDLGAPLLPVLPVTFALDGQRYNYFSAVTILGTPQDITLQEIRIECFFPLDDMTTAAARRLQESISPPERSRAAGEPDVSRAMQRAGVRSRPVKRTAG
ncbi:MAG TPA: helix-turn-helix transcriptional regulator [Vicinamibacterales bacterium]|nr:helix-turn-helix transcriptional regulator [Vicinamibacterales bacterium]